VCVEGVTSRESLPIGWKAVKGAKQGSAESRAEGVALAGLLAVVEPVQAGGPAKTWGTGAHHEDFTNRCVCGGGGICIALCVVSNILRWLCLHVGRGYAGGVG
jgi:hypothetical protein